MLDYHLHLWPHSKQSTDATVEQLAAYCEQAATEGVTELAITEHLHRFRQVDFLAGFWDDDEPSEAIRTQFARYWRWHATADLDQYVGTVLAAKAAGLPVVLGMEVDHYAGRMDEVGALLDGYPFDVLLGSVHWIGAWGFDNYKDDVVLAEWDNRSVEQVWEQYTCALEELAASRTTDVLAHPDLPKLTGRRPAVPDEWYDRMAEAAAAHAMSAEISSAGLHKPVREAYPALPLLRRFKARGVGVTTASDAHRTHDVADRHSDLVALATSAGYTELTAYERRRARPVAIGGG